MRVRQWTQRACLLGAYDTWRMKRLQEWTLMANEPIAIPCSQPYIGRKRSSGHPSVPSCQVAWQLKHDARRY